MSDPVNHPLHYNAGKIEVIEAIEDWALTFHRGNAVKYIVRAGRKDPAKEIEDMEKAIWYLKRDVELLKSWADGRKPVKPDDMEPVGAPNGLQFQEKRGDLPLAAQGQAPRRW